MHAPPKPTDIPVMDAATLATYDAFLFGIPTRYGNFPAQWKAFWDTTSGQWATGGYWGKYAGVFVSSASPGGGQESTVIASLSTLAHHGIIYVPLGYKTTFPILTNMSEVRGGSPWGAGTFAVGVPPLLLPQSRFSNANATELGRRWIPPALCPRDRAGHHPGREFCHGHQQG